MPVYNGERHLREAIESILSQTLGDFEFLIINDGSSDDSEAIILSCKDRRIRYVTNDANRGVSETLNRGLNLAKFDLVARMDADDVSHPDRLKLLHEYLLGTPDCHLVSASTNIISEDGVFLYREKTPGDYLYFNMTFLCWIYHPTVMYRKSTILGLGGYSNRYGEDYNLWSRLIRNYRVGHIDQALLDYRISDGSLFHSAFNKEYLEFEKLQIRDNVRYFMGTDYTIPDEYLECYRNNFTLLLRSPAVTGILECLKELDEITEKILLKENVNRDPVAIRAAADKKKKSILRKIIPELSSFGKAELMVRTGDYRFLKSLGKRIVRGR